MNASSTRYEPLTSMPLRQIARPEFPKPKFKHLLAELANLRELGNVLLVFPDEAILFSKRRNHQGSKVKMTIEIGENKIAFNEKPTRWLGIQLDRKLRFQHHHEVVMARAKKAQARVRTITGKHGLNPANAGKVLVAAVQSIAQYGAELWWDNQIGREQDLQSW
jgi:hypothetical protein